MKIIAVACCISIFLLVLLTVIFYRLKSKKPYKQESFYQITKIAKTKLKKDSDQYGKYLTYKSLQYLEDAGCKFLFNLYIPKKNNETTVIDVLAITHKGLIIIESKNYTGRIFGKQCEKYWTQKLSRDRHSRFYNPILQNATHVLYLDKLMTEKSYPLFSVITFADRCKLDSIGICFNSVPVVHYKDLPAVISQIDNNNPAILTNFEIEQLYEMLYPYSQVSENIKNTHIQTVYEYANAY